MVLRVWLPPTFEGIDPEQEVSRRYRQQHIIKDLHETIQESTINGRM
jgi:hypothetical protein